MSAARTVLVVDDEPTICNLIADCFEEWPGTQVTVAHHGRAGVERLESTRFDLALIELMLPKLSGFDVAQVAVNNLIPVLMLSGHPGATMKLELIGLPYLEKPFRIEDLLRESQHVMATSRTNIARVKASLVRLTERADALKATIDEAQRLLGESMTQTARAEGRIRK